MTTAIVATTPVSFDLEVFDLPPMRVEDRRPHGSTEPSYLCKSCCPCCHVNFLFVSLATHVCGPRL